MHLLGRLLPDAAETIDVFVGLHQWNRPKRSGKGSQCGLLSDGDSSKLPEGHRTGTEVFIVLWLWKAPVAVCNKSLILFPCFPKKTTLLHLRT